MHTPEKNLHPLHRPASPSPASSPSRSAGSSLRAANGVEQPIESASLLHGAPCIAIRHGGELYWLRATRQGKLLLTK